MKAIKKNPARMVMYVSDVESITGRKYEAARKMLYRMKKSLNKKRGDLFTFEDFSLCSKIKEDRIKEFLEV